MVRMGPPDSLRRWRNPTHSPEPVDEPTSAHRAARGLTCLFVSHNLAVIAHMCSEVAIMKAGAIVEQVPTAALRSGALADPYSRQLLKSSEAYDRAAAAALVD